MKVRRLSLVTLMISSILLISGCKNSPQSEPEESQSQPEAAQSAPKEHPKKADNMGKAPEFTLENYDGKEISLSDYDGEVVVLEWFNYECPFCRHHYETTSAMVDMANKYGEKGVVWLAINSTKHQTTEKNKQYANDNNIPFPILDDRDGTVGHKYGATRTPEMFVIDKEGMIVYHGAIDNAPLGEVEGGGEEINYVANALDELLAGEEISTPETKPYGCTVKYAK